MIQGVTNQAAAPLLKDNVQTGGKGNGSFQNILSDAFDEAKQTQQEADQLTARLVSNEPVDLHDVMIATEKADIALQMVLQVRNKLVEAYQEVMRIQI